MLIHLRYFYANGVYHSQVEHKSKVRPDKKDVPQSVCDELDRMRNNGGYPTLSETMSFKVIVYIEFPETGDDPRILPLEGNGSVSFGDNAKGNVTITGRVGDINLRK